MKNRLLAAAALGAFAALPSAALAHDGWYVSGALGYGGPGDTDVTGTLNGEIQGKGDLREKLALGHAWASGWRLEGELAHRFNDTGAIGHFENSASDLQTWSGMLNLAYDFHNNSSWTPYVGAGLGWASVSGSFQGYDTGTFTDGVSTFWNIQDTDQTLAWQLFAGLGWALTDQLTLDTEYRYFVLSDTDFEPGLDMDSVGGHELWLGLRYAFGATPPPPPPPPPPTCVDSNFVVYFEWDRSHLTDQARAVINQAVREAGSCGYSSVNIDGHADRSGNATYNVGLSERRARAVRDEMVRLGVPASAISLDAFGESRNARATPDGVREPLNRRAEVMIDLR